MQVTIELILWLLICFSGIGIGVLALREAQSDKKYLTDSGFNGVRLIIANGTIRREMLRLVPQLMFTIIGLMALFSPPPEDPPPRTIASIIFAYLLIGAAAVLTTNSWMDRRMRRKLHLAIDKRDRELHGDPSIAAPTLPSEGPQKIEIVELPEEPKP